MENLKDETCVKDSFYNHYTIELKFIYYMSIHEPFFLAKEVKENQKSALYTLRVNLFRNKQVRTWISCIYPGSISAVEKQKINFDIPKKYKEFIDR